VALLSELDGKWPPILVSRETDEIIDGHHRVAAARQLRQSSIAAVLFDGDPDDAYVEAVRRNVEFGLPLTLEERRMAATRLLESHTDWSNRRIAAVCALSARTVDRIRARCPVEEHGPSRVGRDGRVRHVPPELNRLLILDAVRATPEASLRTIAKAVGTSAETVRRVRLAMDLVSADADHLGGATIPPALAPRPAIDLHRRLATEPAVSSTADGRHFAAWFDATDVGPRWSDYVSSVPLSRVYEVADEARRRARAWANFAEAVEERSRGRSAV
jgi:hypothetical protein